MTRTISLAAAIALAAGASAYAADEPTSAGECVQLLEATEILVEEKTLDGDAAESANELLLALDKQCNDAAYADAKATADKLEELVGAS